MSSELITEDGDNLADGLFAISASLDAVARSLNRLGNNNAATDMGAVEGLAKYLGDALREGLRDVSDAIHSASQQ